MNTFTEFCTWQEAPGKLVSHRTNKDDQFVMLRVSIPYIVKHGHSIAFVVRAQIPLPNNICAFKGFHRTTQETGIRKFPSLNFPGKEHPKPKTSFIILKLGNPFSPPQCFPHINNLYMNSLDFQHSHVQQGSGCLMIPPNLELYLQQSPFTIRSRRLAATMVVPLGSSFDDYTHKHKFNVNGE